MSALPKYQIYLRCDCWINHIRQVALERANFVCQARLRCRGARATEVHHRNGYACVGREKPNDLWAICFACHRAFHGDLQLPVPANDNKQLDLPMFLEPKMKPLPLPANDNKQLDIPAFLDRRKS